MVEFRLFGIPVRVEMAFWITIAILAAIGVDLRSSGALLDIALFMLAAFISILVHEMGHALMIKKYRLPTQVVLSSFGGFATHPAGYLTRKQSFLVTAAGPALQMLSAIIPFLLLHYNLADAPKINYFFFIYMAISLIWAILNCLPVLPLDGGHMLAAILGPKRQKLVYLISLIVASLVSVFALLKGFYYGAIFMGFFAYQSYQIWQQLKNKRF